MIINIDIFQQKKIEKQKILIRMMKNILNLMKMLLINKD